MYSYRPKLHSKIFPPDYTRLQIPVPIPEFFADLAAKNVSCKYNFSLEHDTNFITRITDHREILCDKQERKTVLAACLIHSLML